MPTHEGLAARYRGMSDAQLADFAAERAGDLTPDALAALKAELGRRGLGAQVDDAVDAQLRELAPGELERLVEAFRHTACPICGKKRGPLDAIRVFAPGVVATTRAERSALVGCPPCLADARQRSNTAAVASSVLFGAAGLIRGVRWMFSGRDDLTARGPSRELVDYVREHRGVVVRRVEEATLGEAAAR